MIGLAFGSGAAAAWRRVGVRGTLVIGALCLAAACAAAAVAKRAFPLGAPDATVAVTLGLLLPLAALALSSRAADGGRLDASVWAIGRHGLSRRYAALGLVCGAMALTAVVFTPVTLTALAIAYGATPGLGKDALTCAWVAALGAACYAALFGLGSSFGRRGGGRVWLLGLDLVFGGGSGAVSALFPRAHLASLLGARPVIGLSERGSSLLVALGTVLIGCLAALRVPD